MEDFIATMSPIWDKFTAIGAYAVQQLVFGMGGLEIKDSTATFIFVGSVAGVLLWLIMLAFRPRKPHYLMEAGFRHHRHDIEH